MLKASKGKPENACMDARWINEKVLGMQLHTPLTNKHHVVHLLRRPGLYGITTFSGLLQYCQLQIYILSGGDKWLVFCCCCLGSSIVVSCCVLIVACFFCKILCTWPIYMKCNCRNKIKTNVIIENGCNSKGSATSSLRI